MALALRWLKHRGRMNRNRWFYCVCTVGFLFFFFGVKQNKIRHSISFWIFFVVVVALYFKYLFL